MNDVDYTSLYIKNLPYEDGQIRVEAYSGNVEMFSALIYDFQCSAVLHALSTKLGTPPHHTTQRFVNGFGAAWTGETWWWNIGSSQVVYSRHTDEMTGCYFVAQTAKYEKLSQPAKVVQP